MKKILTIAAILLAAAVSASAQSGTWSGKLEVQGMELPIVFHLEDENPTADSPDQGARGIPIEVDRKATGAIVIRIPSLGAVFEGQWVLRQIVGTFTQMGVSLPLTLVPGDLKRNRPQTPQGPFPYGQEEVTFKNGGSTLKGTLTLPSDFTRETPALVMVTGSGQQNRDEEIMQHKPFLVLADYLASRGIAMLRYDDRGVGGSTGVIDSADTRLFSEDAEAMLRAVKGNRHVDNRRLGMGGHSEGGAIAPMVAARNSDVRFVVMLAGQGCTGTEVMVQQNEALFRSRGVSERLCKVRGACMRELFALPQGSTVKDYQAVILRHAEGLGKAEADSIELKKGMAYAIRQQLGSRWMQSFLGLDPAVYLPRVKCPVLALNGTKDCQVLAEPNMRRIKELCPRVDCRAVEGLNHLFQHCSTGDAAEYMLIEETFAPEAMQAVADWILGLR